MAKHDESFSSSIQRMRGLISDLFVPNPYFYWADYLSCTLLGWACFLASVYFSLPLYIHLPIFLIAIFSLYRSIAFNHDMIHGGDNFPKGLGSAWLIFTGIPLGVPTFIYKRLHLAHHRITVYAGEKDPEYADFPHSNREVAIFLASSLILPVLSWVRFLILSPLSLLHPKIRRLVRTRASSIGIRLAYERELPSDPREIRSWNLEEAATSCWFWLLAIGGILHWIPLSFFVHWYFLIVGITTANAIRALAATHGYALSGAAEVSLQDEYLDSVNLDTRSPIAMLLCPMGLRYHALHHLFPTLPYHSLPKAHRRIVAGMSEERWYASTQTRSLTQGLRRVFPKKPELRRGSEAISADH